MRTELKNNMKEMLKVLLKSGVEKADIKTELFSIYLNRVNADQVRDFVDDDAKYYYSVVFFIKNLYGSYYRRFEVSGSDKDIKTACYEKLNSHFYIYY